MTKLCEYGDKYPTIESAAERIREYIEEALEEVEVAIKEDPNNRSYYFSIKNYLLLADNDVSFVIND